MFILVVVCLQIAHSSTTFIRGLMEAFHHLRRDPRT